MQCVILSLYLIFQEHKDVFQPFFQPAVFLRCSIMLSVSPSCMYVVPPARMNGEKRSPIFTNPQLPSYSTTIIKKRSTILICRRAELLNHDIGWMFNQFKLKHVHIYSHGTRIGCCPLFIARNVIRRLYVLMDSHLKHFIRLLTSSGNADYLM